jgi:SnoaL-like domain
MIWAFLAYLVWTMPPASAGVGLASPIIRNEANANNGSRALGIANLLGMRLPQPTLDRSASASSLSAITAARGDPEAQGRNAMDDRTVRAALQRHWDASDANDFDAEHEIYRDDAMLEYPQSGERIRGRHNIQESRFVQPNKKRFTVRRIIGNGDLWITEFVLTYDGIPSYAVSIMEFREGLVANETQYFADRFEPALSRAHLVERVE